jgi:hypothetical protein
MPDTINYEYISSQELMTDPDFLADVLNVEADERTLLDIMDILPGSKEVTIDPLFHAKFAKSVMKKAIQSGAPSGDGSVAGTSVTITVTSAIDLPKVGDYASFGLPGTTDKGGVVTAVTPATPSFTVAPIETTRKVGVSADTDEWIAAGSMHIEGGSAPEGQKPEWYDTQNAIQIFKDADEVTDLNDAIKMKFKHNGSPRVLYKMQADLLLRHRLKIAAGLMVGLQSASKDANDYRTYSTQGLYNYIKGGDGKKLTTGGTVTSLGGAATTLAKIRTTIRATNKKKGPKRYMLYNGGDWNADFEEEVRALEGVANGIRWDQWGTGDAQKRAMDLGIDAFRVYGVQLDCKMVDAFDDTNQFASKGYADLAGTSLWVPQSQVKIDHGKATVNRMRLRYMASSLGTQYLHDENRDGRLVKSGTSSARLKIDYETIVGLECLGIEQFAMQTKA